MSKFYLLLFIFLFFSLYVNGLSKNNGFFWQITDIHWDLRYAQSGDPKRMCHEFSNVTDENGKYGNYLCDSPWPLVQSSIQAMSHIYDKPNFILWTGDNAPHTDDPEPDFTTIFKTISNVSSEIRSAFDSNIPIYPVLGNHDTYPKDDYPANGDKLTNFYERYLIEGGWNILIPEESQEDFKKGGYYVIDVSPQLMIMVLNTNLYYAWNEMGTNAKDPCGQFDFMKKHFDSARSSSKKIIVTAHAPPGYFERNFDVPFFNSTYNKAYVDVLTSNADVILTQIYGHIHTDTFRIFSDNSGDLKSIAFMAPSVTPWFPSRLIGGTPINPSLRLYTYNAHNLLDYTQYHFNLSEINSNNSVPNWKQYYKASDLYDSHVLNVDNMAVFVKSMEKNEDLFNEYYRISSAGIDHGHCNETCKKTFLCVIRYIHISDVEKCMKRGMEFDKHTTPKNHVVSGSLVHGPSSKGHSKEKSPHVFIAIIVGTTACFIIVGIMSIVVSVRRKKILGSTERLAQFEWNYRQEGYRPLQADTN